MARRTDPQQVFSFARPKRTKGGLERQECEALLDRLRQDALRVARAFGLPEFDLDADRAEARSRYGLCFSDGRIRVRLVNVRTGRVLKYSALIDTVVHELAHLRYMDHGPRWEALYRRMLEWCRRRGIYTPRAVADPALPVRQTDQLSLFGSPTSTEGLLVRDPVLQLNTAQQVELARSVLEAVTKG